jgi:hypothetical protein
LDGFLKKIVGEFEGSRSIRNPFALITVGAFLAGFQLAIFCDYYANRRRFCDPGITGINGFSGL